ncbi:heparan sulfate glucosamine 3-O-sulfotransferase 1-like [Mya arenaria]|uniref:heparan sulfate glucosamine 3-O-sulfotransferase 1-like n=1 Tax=Mya arenaria TaxID=6604 RepID=UPI0022E8420A|nr:heparan sulfate glucosamine 3-O-sulfotransferase 1-like [Mya arenaria]
MDEQYETLNGVKWISKKEDIHSVTFRTTLQQNHGYQDFNGILANKQDKHSETLSTTLQPNPDYQGANGISDNKKDKHSESLGTTLQPNPDYQGANGISDNKKDKHSESLSTTLQPNPDYQGVNRISDNKKDKHSESLSTTLQPNPDYQGINRISDNKEDKHSASLNKNFQNHPGYHDANWISSNKQDNDSDILNTTLQHTLDDMTPTNTPEACIKRFPRAIIAGIQKGGTYGLLYFLNKHPQVVGCLHPIEPKFFIRNANDDDGYTNYVKVRFGNHSDTILNENNTDILKWEHRFQNYKNIMPCSYSNQITMEKDPAYFCSEVAAKRIYQWNPDIRLVFIVKDPVERAISAIAMFKARGDIDENTTVDDIVLTNDSNGKKQVNSETGALKESNYQLYMREWLSYFRREQILFVDGHKFESDPAGELKNVETFLEIDHFFHSSMFILSKSKGKFCFVQGNNKPQCLPKGKGRKHPYVSEETLSLLKEYFAPKNAQFFKMVNQTFEW